MLDIKRLKFNDKSVLFDINKNTSRISEKYFVGKIDLRLKNGIVVLELISEKKVEEITEINWEGIQQFLDHFYNNYELLISYSQNYLKNLAKIINPELEESIQNYKFNLQEVTLFSLQLHKINIDNNYFINHKFNLNFLLCLKEDEFDINANWITKWTGNRIAGIERRMH